MEAPFYTLDEFPENMSSTEGMKIIYGKDETGITCLPDEVYAEKDGMQLHLRMMFPTVLNTSHRYPAIFHIQGSGWSKQNLNCHMGHLAPLVRAGYAVIIIEYRYAPLHRFPCQVEDGKTAIRFIMRNLDRFPVDTNNLYLSGDSSGGHTAMLMMATWHTMECDAEKTELPELNGCIDFYGSVNILTMNDAPTAFDHNAPHSASSQYLGFCPPENPEECSRRMPFYYIHENTIMPPILIMHGSKDLVVPFTQSLELYQHMKGLGKDVEFYKVNNAGHGGNVFWCSATISVVLSFLNSKLLAPLEKQGNRT